MLLLLKILQAIKLSVNLLRVDTAVFIILGNQEPNFFKHQRRERGELTPGGGSVLKDTTVTTIMTKLGREIRKCIALTVRQ